MNTALGNELFLGILLGLYIQVFLLGIIIILGSRWKIRSVILGCFCYIMASSTLYNIFWPTLNHSFIANLFLAGFKDMFVGPLLFLYIILLGKIANVKQLLVWHLTIPTLMTLGYLTLKFGLSNFYFQNYAVIGTGFLVARTLSFLFYIIFMWLEKKKIELVIPSLLKKYLIYFYLVLGYFFLTSVLDVLSIYVVGWGQGTYQWLNTYVYTPMGFLIYFFTLIFAISEHNGLKNFFIPKSPYISQEVAYNRNEIETMLEQKLISSRAFKDPYLTTKKAAKLLSVNPAVLIEYIRIHHNQSFNEFLANLRLEEFKKICRDKNHENLSISGMAYEAGFKSKATFYRMFKQQMGISPGAFIAQQKGTD